MKFAILGVFLLSLNAVSTAVDICEDQKDGTRLAHPLDFSKFVVCEQEKSVLIAHCPAGIQFNRCSGECDIKITADCDLSPVDDHKAIKGPLKGDDRCGASCCSCCGCGCGCCCGSPSIQTSTPTPTQDPTLTPTPIPDQKPTTTPTPIPTQKATPTPTPIPTPTPTPTPITDQKPTTTPTPIPTQKATPTPTPIPTPTPTPIPDQKPTPTPTPTPKQKTTPTPTATPTLTPTPTPAQKPTPTQKPTPKSTLTPTPIIPTPETPVHDCTNNLIICHDKKDDAKLQFEGDCNKYVVCFDSCANIMSCPNNLLFNPKTNKCEDPKNVKCPWESTPPHTGPSGTVCNEAGKCKNQPDGKTFVSNTSQHFYVVCQCECERLMPCPADLVFNENLGVCDWPAGSIGGHPQQYPLVTCDNNNTACFGELDGTLKAANGSCSSFYKCVFGCTIEFTCPNNLLFNSEIQVCDYPQNVNCPWSYKPTKSFAICSPNNTCVNPGRCIGQDEGTVFPSTNSCSNYVTCQCGCEVEMSCSAGMLFDVDSEMCNFAEDVRCLK